MMRGDGFIRRERDGWRAYITIVGKRRKRRFASERKAEDWLAGERRKKRKAEAGLAVDLTPGRSVTVAKLAVELQQHWEAGTERVFTEATLDSYRLELARVVERFGPRPIDRIRKADVNAWVKELRDAGLSTSSIRGRLDRISQLFRLAEDCEYIGTAPFRVRRPRLIQRSEPEAVPEAEYARLVEAAERSADPRRLAVILLAGDAGLRRAEIVRLRWEDLTLGAVVGGSEHGVIHVAVRGEGDRTKSGRARTVPILTARLRAALEALSWPGRVGPVIAGITRVTGLHYMAERVWVEAGAGENARLHQLRHRFGTWCADEGVPTKLLRDWMGHSTVLTTERYFRRRGGAVDPALVTRLGASALQEQSPNSPQNSRNASK